MGVSEHEQMGGNATMRPQPFWASWNPHFSAHLFCCSRNVPFTHTTLQSPGWSSSAEELSDYLPPLKVVRAAPQKSVRIPKIASPVFNQTLQGSRISLG